MAPSPSTKTSTEPQTGRSAFFVATGILVTRLTGLVRQRLFAHYFGLGPQADAFSAAFRIPNVLQNLFGEGALSGSFIPVYAALVARGDRRLADRVAGAVLSLLALVVAAIVLVGVLATPLLIDLIAPGFSGEKRALTIHLVRVLFPGTGLLVLSAWCLGVLNSHHRFLVSYTAPVALNAAMIVTLVLFGDRTELPRLAVVLAWGAVVGSALQALVQVPPIVRLAPGLRPVFETRLEEVRTIVRNFGPVFVSRGVVQLSAYVDTLLASLLGTGAVAGLTNVQLLYTLPVSLFGMSVSAAELPTMSSTAGTDRAAAEALRRRLDGGLRQIAFFVVPSAVAFLALGDLVAGALFQTGRFTRGDALYLWALLAGSAVGLLASTLGRLYSSAFYALRDTRTPLRCAVVRVALTTVLGYLCALPLPRLLGLAPEWGAAGLTASAGVAGWVEMLMLRRALNPRIGRTGLGPDFILKLWIAAGVSAAVASLLRFASPTARPVIAALVVLGPYGVSYLGVAWALGVREASDGLARAVKRVSR